MLSKSKRDRYWIGLSDGQIVGYHWSDLTPLDYVNWGKGEPNNHNGKELCVQLVINADLSTSTWNDYFCYATNSWVCQIPRGKENEFKII